MLEKYTRKITESLSFSLSEGIRPAQFSILLQEKSLSCAFVHDGTTHYYFDDYTVVEVDNGGNPTEWRVIRLADGKEVNIFAM